MKQEVFYIDGDGIGMEVSQVARLVLDTAIEKTYNDGRKIVWRKLLAGAEAFVQTGEYMPKETLEALQTAKIAIKGPLETPVGKGFRSLNVMLRRVLDLYACIRPIHYFPGIESPVKNPEKVNMVIFRENTEDVYAGIEWAAQSKEAKKLIEFLSDEMGVKIDINAGIGLKPMTENGCKRLIRKAIEFAIATKKTSVTLVHKGNIMKYTEGAFRQWGYDLAAEEFGSKLVTEKMANNAVNKIIIKDRIADAMFQEALIRPENYSVIATSNLNGDYLSDALAAQVGGLGLAPGMNMGDKLAFFEATHGTAPTIAGQDKANPGSIILSAAMMLDHLGWTEAANKVRDAVSAVIATKHVTEDLASQMAGSTVVGCNKFAEQILENL